MALDISALAKIEKNKLATTSLWAVLMKITLPDTTVIRVCSNNEDIIWPSDFVEPLSDYTMVDPNGRFTVALNQVAIANMTRNEQT